MKNKKYWEERFRQLEASQHQSSQKLVAEIQQQMRRAEAAIENKINSWYGRMAENNGISMAEAKKLLNRKELEEFRWDVNDYIRYGRENAVNRQWMKQLENASAKVHISRLEQLKLQVQQETERLYGNYLDGVDRHIKSLYEEGFYKTAYEIQKGIGVGWNLTGVDSSRLDRIIRKPWAADGKNFSERIWSGKQQLIESVHTSLTQMCILGQSPDRAIASLSHAMHTSKNQAGKLIMTESAFFGSESRKDCFNELGVEQYEIVATLDAVTSDICREMDGKVFPMSEYQSGSTAPPFHVWCRTTTVPAFGDEFDHIGERAARNPETGKTYYVPADMKYREWKESFVEKSHQEENKRKETSADYLIRSHVPGQDIAGERKIVEETISSMPAKVRDALEQGTIVDIGKEGASQYDYTRDILYIAKGADKTTVIHEIGHMVENKLMDSTNVLQFKNQMLEGVMPNNFVNEIYYAGDEPVEIFLIKDDRFVSDYQGRVYIDDWSELLDEEMCIKPELLVEFISEAFREYIENPERLEKEFPKFYKMIMRAVE